MGVRDRLERDGDPWAAIDDTPQSLEPLLALHERDRANGLHDAPWPPVYPKQPDEAATRRTEPDPAGEADQPSRFEMPRNWPVLRWRRPAPTLRAM